MTSLLCRKPTCVQRSAANDAVEIPVDLEHRYHKAFTMGWNCYDLGGHAGQDCPWYSGREHGWYRPNSRRAPAFERAWKAGYYAARFCDRSSQAAQSITGKVMTCNDAALRTIGLSSDCYSSDNVGFNGERADGMRALGTAWLAMDPDTLSDWLVRIYRDDHPFQSHRQSRAE